LSDYKLLALIVKEIQKLKQEREAYAAAGRCDNIEEYRKICGIILGLNYAENIIEDLVQKMEKADD
jgi:hypothetical protein